MATGELSLGIVIGAALSSSFKSSFDTSKKSIAQLGSKIADLNKIKVKLKASGMGDEAIAQIKKVNREIAKLKLEARIKLKLEDSKDAIASQKADAIALGASSYALAQPVGTFNQVEQRKGQIASLGSSEQGISLLQKTAENSSKKYGEFNVDQILESSYDLKSGISSLNDEMLAEYQRVTTTLASATKGSMPSAVNMVTLGYGVFRSQFKDDQEFLYKFTAGIGKTVQLYKTTGDDLALGLSNLGSTATSLKVPMQEQLAIIGTAKSAYGSASEASTGYKSMLVGVGEAQKDLGLKFVDSSGKMLPITDILEKIEGKYGDLSKVADSDTLKKAFGSDEAVKFLKVMLANKKGLDGQKEINAEMQKGTELIDKMAMSMQRGRGIEIMGNNLSLLSGRIGKVFAPAVDLATNAIGWMADKLVLLIDRFPQISSAIGGVIIGVFGIALALKTATIAKLIFNFLGLSFRSGLLKNTIGTRIFSGALRLLGGSMLFAGRAILWVGRAFLMNPIGLAITAIAAGAYLIYKNWAPIKSFFADMINSIAKWFNNLFGWFDKKIQTVGSVISKVKGLFGSDDTVQVKALRPATVPAMRRLGTNVPSSSASIIQTKQSTPSQTDMKQRIAQIPSKPSTSNVVTVNIHNPSFKNKEEASATQKQIRDEVRKAMRDIQNDKKDRSYS